MRDDRERWESADAEALEHLITKKWKTTSECPQSGPADTVIVE